MSQLSAPNEIAVSQSTIPERSIVQQKVSLPAIGTLHIITINRSPPDLPEVTFALDTFLPLHGYELSLLPSGPGSYLLLATQPSGRSVVRLASLDLGVLSHKGSTSLRQS